jgi:hypothetical protein
MNYAEWLAQASDLRLAMIYAEVLQGKPNTYKGNESKYYEQCFKDKETKYSKEN